MGYTNNLLDDVRAQLAPEDTVLKEARERRDIVCAAAESFRGATRSFASGSLAHKTANCPIHQRDKGLDADCGVVLSRVFFPELGPDGTAKEGPDDILAAVLAHTRPRVLRRWPRATFTITKRAIYIEFHAPLPGGVRRAPAQCTPTRPLFEFPATNSRSVWIEFWVPLSSSPRIYTDGPAGASVSPHRFAFGERDTA